MNLNLTSVLEFLQLEKQTAVLYTLTNNNINIKTAVESLTLHVIHNTVLTMQSLLYLEEHMCSPGHTSAIRWYKVNY